MSRSYKARCIYVLMMSSSLQTNWAVTDIKMIKVIGLKPVSWPSNVFIPFKQAYMFVLSTTGLLELKVLLETCHATLPAKIITIDFTIMP